MLFTENIDKCCYMLLMDERKKLSPLNNPGPSWESNPKPPYYKSGAHTTKLLGTYRKRSESYAIY